MITAQITDNCCAECPDGVVIRVNGAITQTVLCCPEVGCLDPIITPIVNGQSTITNPNDTPLTVTISSGSGTFQNPIPANSTVIVTNIVGGDGVNAAGEAIKTFCITGNC